MNIQINNKSLQKFNNVNFIKPSKYFGKNNSLHNINEKTQLKNNTTTNLNESQQCVQQQNRKNLENENIKNIPVNNEIVGLIN